VFLSWPVHYQVKTQGVAVPVDQVELAAPADAQIAAIYVNPGEWVDADQPILQLYSPSLEALLLEAKAQEALARLEAARYMDSSLAQEEALAAQANLQLKAAWAYWNEIKALQDQLTIKAPFKGQILTPHLQDLLGLFVAEGTPLVSMGDMGSVQLLIPLTQAQTGLLLPHASVYGRWVAHAQSFHTTLKDLPQRQALPTEYAYAFYATYGGPAPFQQLRNDSPFSPDDLYPIFLAQTNLLPDSGAIQYHMRAKVVIEGRKTIRLLRLWRSLLELLS